MPSLDKGSIVHAEFISSSGAHNAGPHYAIVLNKRDEINATGLIQVAVITSNDTIALPEDLIQVPPGIFANRKKPSWICCSWLREINTSGVFDVYPKRIYGPPLLKVESQVRVVKARFHE